MQGEGGRGVRQKFWKVSAALCVPSAVTVAGLLRITASSTMSKKASASAEVTAADEDTEASRAPVSLPPPSARNNHRHALGFGFRV